MPTKIQELRQDHRGDRSQCPICNPRSGRVREDQVWAWAQSHPGENPWR